MKKLARIAVSVFLTTIPVAAADFSKGAAAAKRGDYLTALREWLPLADKGDPVAQFNLGIIHSHGLGVPHNPTGAVEWWYKSAIQGNAAAQFNLGLMYYKGQGVSQNAAAAVRWWREAADQGNTPAQFRLGFMYVAGKGVPRDFVLAYKWWNLAAANDHRNTSKGRAQVSKIMTPAQIAEAQRLAREWLAKFEARKR